MSTLRPIGNDQNIPSVNVLRLQQKSVSRAILGHLHGLLVWMMMSTMICAVFIAHGSPQQKTALWFVILPLFLLIGAAFCLDLIRFLRLRSYLGRVREANTYEITIHCKKVRFLCRANGRQNLIVCLQLIDQSSEVYDYIYPRKNEPILLFADDLKKRLLTAETTLTCYRGTNIVKAIDL